MKIPGAELTLDIEGTRRFHGHWCPGLAIGIRVAEIALREIGPHAEDEEVVAIVETDMCAVDAIQYLTGCTFGKGNLIHRDYGKNAFTFIRRSDGRAIRIVLRAAPDDEAATGEQALLEAALDERAAPEELERAGQALRQDRAQAILGRPLEELFEVQAVDLPIPPPARIHGSVRCAGCGEAVMETRARLLDGEAFCLPCFEVRDRRR
ncbi:MAG: FmdE family protein [Anaerolineae bacterium]|nr:FmdE family protein [Anaerolineae bacterium]